MLEPMGVCVVPNMTMKGTVDLLELDLEFLTKLLHLLNLLSELEKPQRHGDH